MIRIKKTLTVWLCLGAMALPSHGQGPPEPNGNHSPVESLVGNVDGFSKRRAAPPPPAAGSMINGLFIVGTLSLLGLAAIGVGGLMRHSYPAGARRFRFPTVDRPQRLGAPCGGNVTARRFAPPAPRPP